jgi:hypothetical protein
VPAPRCGARAFLGSTRVLWHPSFKIIGKFILFLIPRFQHAVILLLGVGAFGCSVPVPGAQFGQQHQHPVPVPVLDSSTYELTVRDIPGNLSLDALPGLTLNKINISFCPFVSSFPLLPENSLVDSITLKALPLLQTIPLIPRKVRAVRIVDCPLLSGSLYLDRSPILSVLLLENLASLQRIYSHTNALNCAHRQLPKHSRFEFHGQRTTQSLFSLLA